MEPADSIIQKFGGPSKIAGICGVHRTRATNWKRPANKGGTGGLIPQRHHETLLKHAAANGIELTANDFRQVAASSAGEGAP